MDKFMITVEARPQTNIESTHCLADVQTSADDPKVFDVSLYRNLFNQVLRAGLSKEEARDVVEFAVVNDGLGLVTEKLSGEKDQSGQYIFGVEDRIRMQLTPHKHFYLEEKDELTQESLMVAPEHRWGRFKKDVLANISGWRRGMDKVGMAGVRTVFLGEDSSLTEGESIVWGSPKAEEGEGELIRKYNGVYGFLYWGRVTNANGQKVLEVRDFKNDLGAAAYEQFFHKLEGEVYTNPLYSEHPLVDKVKASLVKTQKNFTIEDIWVKLSKVQKEVTGRAEIFGLPVETILALQDTELHQRIKNEVAVPIGGWIADEIYNETPVEVIQNQVRQKFISKTVKLMSKIKIERSRDEQIKDYKASDYLNRTIVLHNNIANATNPAILARYSGSNGGGCGSWGSTSSSGGFGGSVSSVSGLSSVFSGTEKIGGICNECGKSSSDDHYHCDRCNKRYASERHSSSRTSQCSCGRKFGC